MIIRNISRTSRFILGKIVRPNRTIEVDNNFKIDKYLEIVSKSSKSVKKSKINYDLNGDGKFDSKDKSIAGKILASKKR